MHWIFEFLIRHRNFSSLLVTVFLSLFLISSNSNQQTIIARSLTMYVFFPFQITLDKITQINNIYSENKRLKREVTQLNATVALLKEQAVENNRLRSLLEFGQEFTFDLVPARVIARDPSVSFRSVVINTGLKDSIQQWMPVVSERGVVGKVVQVLNGISMVQLLRDPSNRTSVMVQRPRTVSILETENGSDFYIRCRTHEDIKTGDTIVTSGLGGIYPRGFRVGVISKITDVNNPLFVKAYIKLFVDFNHLEELFVLKMSPQWTAFKDELDSLMRENGPNNN